MKKKILAIVLCVAMLAIAIVGGTMAYFTDTDADVNTMVSGSVAIRQDEWMRNEAGTALVEYQDQTLLPAVIYDENGNVTSSWGAAAYAEDTSHQYTVEGLNDTFQMPDRQRMRNVVDKVVTVTNTGENDAYVRTLVMIEDPNGTVMTNLEMMYDSVHYPAKFCGYFTVDGARCFIIEFIHSAKIAPKETTYPSAMAFWMNPAVDNGDVPEEFHIIAFSQAVQADGFDDATTAIYTAFGEVTQDNLDDWFAGEPQA